MNTSSKMTVAALACLLTFAASAQEPASEKAILPTEADIVCETQSQSKTHEELTYGAKKIMAYALLSGLIGISSAVVKFALFFAAKQYNPYAHILGGKLFSLLAVKLATMGTKRFANIELSNLYLYICSEVVSPIIIQEIIDNREQSCGRIRCSDFHFFDC